MKHEIDTINLANIEYYPAIQNTDLPEEKIIKFPLSKITSLGIAFQPLTTIIQTAITGGGGSGIYFVNTHGKSMFQKNGSKNFIGALKSNSGKVGGGQATMTPLACDPTMLFMAVTFINIEKKLEYFNRYSQQLSI